MNDGVKILLERMQTHPEEFHGEHNRWSDVINTYEKFFNTSERALINGALTNIRREELTSVVVQELLREPTMVERQAVRFRSPTEWATSAVSIQEHVLQARSDAMRIEMQTQIMQSKLEETKAEKNNKKMKQLLQNVTKRRQVY